MYKETISAMEFCLKYNPNYPSAHYITGESMKAVGTKDSLSSAVEMFEKELCIYPFHSDS